MISDKMREQFEAWAATNGMAMHLARAESGLYVSRVTQNYMDCWMASRTAVVVPLPEIHKPAPAGDERWHSIRNATIDSCRRAIESQGLRVKP